MKRDFDNRPRRFQRAVYLASVGAAVFAVAACASSETSSHKWKQFTQVEGQPEPVPVEWVATPSGKFAHSIKIPNPVPKDSGYRRGMTSEEYFKVLCEREAGTFIFTTANDVQGLLLMRPPNPPTDEQLKDRYWLEAPEIERTFQLIRPRPEDRAKIFISPPFNSFLFVEEPSSDGLGYVRASGYSGGKSPMQLERASSRRSRYGLVWRGISRPFDRDLGIAGGEWIVIDLDVPRVMAVMRNFTRAESLGSAGNQVWWLNAISCPAFAQKYKFPTSEKLYDFTEQVLRPASINPRGAK